ncbi:MAG TPA: TAXI family TRAP transporter solute-binding subunit [Acidobacteriaceae bacterium]
MSRAGGWMVAVVLIVAGLAGAQAVQPAQNAAASIPGIGVKRPVFGGACRLCPWGAMAQVVKSAMQFYGYDVQICHNCNAVDSARIVALARVPPPYKKDPAVSVAMAPPNDPGLGPVDFGATAEQFMCQAYDGSGPYARDKPMKNLRMIANIQSPWWLVVAARSETGITDLAQVADQIKERRRPVRIYAARTDAMVTAILAYYGLTVDAITAAGGYVGNSFADRENFDVIIQGGALSSAPEWNVLYQVSQRFDLNYLDIPEPVLAKLAAEPLHYRGTIPVGLLRGVERPIPTIVRNGTVVYTRADVPESFAYAVAKAMDEHQDELQWTNQNFSYNVHTVWKPPCDVPLAAGAARYYRKVGYMK